MGNIFVGSSLMHQSHSQVKHGLAPTSSSFLGTVDLLLDERAKIKSLFIVLFLESGG